MGSIQRKSQKGKQKKNYNSIEKTSYQLGSQQGLGGKTGESQHPLIDEEQKLQMCHVLSLKSTPIQCYSLSTEKLTPKPLYYLAYPFPAC